LIDDNSPPRDYIYMGLMTKPRLGLGLKDNWCAITGGGN
jgi:hypothetical protein